MELPIVAALAVEELPVVVVNPRQVRDLPGQLGSWPRPLDAAVLAHLKRSGLLCALCADESQLLLGQLAP